ncbi:hypothetical protein [Streptomyces sp. RK9]|uniref:hypothetical protein n=1 Tax=Streptomyces sp. RK9 TaxID=3239284 RepID=UPI00386CF48A
MRHVFRGAGLLAAAGALTLVGSGTASAGVFGTIDNRTPYYFDAGDLEGGSSRCKIWNKDGGSKISNKTFDCTIENIAPHTQTGTWFDADSLRPRGGQNEYKVRWGDDGHWTWVSTYVYTKIQSDEIAKCTSTALGLVECTVD